MSADEYKAALAALGLNLAQAARLLDVDYSTSRRWGDGRTAVPPPVARFLRYLVRSGTTPSEVWAYVEESDAG